MIFFFPHVWSPYFLYLSLLFSCSRADSSSKKTKSSSEESRSETYGKPKLQPPHPGQLLLFLSVIPRLFPLPWSAWLALQQGLPFHPASSGAPGWKMCHLPPLEVSLGAAGSGDTAPPGLCALSKVCAMFLL